jgi:UDP-N-acetylmuramyl pentapeptide phosphotransferase/UDP-N-acetylglucosamine-1-phosphate transferase
MKKVYIYMFVGITAIVLVIVILFNFDPKTETWGSLLLGALLGFLLFRMPSIIRNIKQKNTK